MKGAQEAPCHRPKLFTQVLKISVLQMETQLEIEEKNDMGRLSFGEQGP